MRNYVFQLLHGIKNIFSKHVVPVTYRLGKMFFTVATFESLLIVSLQSKKLVVNFGLCDSSLVFQRREEQTNTVGKK